MPRPTARYTLDMDSVMHAGLYAVQGTVFPALCSAAGLCGETAAVLMPLCVCKGPGWAEGILKNA